jgi:hypothetical protein
MLWRPAAKKDLMELSGPIKRIAPKDLPINVRKEVSIQDSSIIECGKCGQTIYRADNGIDAEALKKARKKHYSVSPGCEEQISLR